MTESTINQTGIMSKVGHHYRVDDYYEVGREKVREYARAVQDHHPAHWRDDAAAGQGYGGLVAPLTFVSIPAMAANRKLFETVVTGYDVFVQAEQVFEQHKPIVAGDRLVADVTLSSVRQIAGKDLITVTNTFTDDSGETVHVMHTTVVGVTGEEVDPAITSAVEDAVMHGITIPTADNAGADHEPSMTPRDAPLSTNTLTRTPATTLSFDDIAVGDELPPRDARLTRGDLVNYAGVSGDANPIHWHDRIATMAGLPEVIAHGMLTMGLGIGFVSSWLGDPGAIKRYAVRLSSPAPVQARHAGQIEFTGRVKSLDPQTRSAVIVIVAKSAGKKIFGLATAEVRLR